MTDINSFCPRDYVRETKKTQDDVKIHNYRAKSGVIYEDFSLVRPPLPFPVILTEHDAQ